MKPDHVLRPLQIPSSPLQQSNGNTIKADGELSRQKASELKIKFEQTSCPPEVVSSVPIQPVISAILSFRGRIERTPREDKSWKELSEIIKLTFLQVFSCYMHSQMHY
uniref:Uncharacterized protein n=1 Tax=Glossina pallidipes TaxID=7398 RepID=A0A1B0AFD0_GLOPL